MQSEAQARHSVADEEDAEDGGAANVSVTYGWMPTSGYGPYCTIPISSGIGGTALVDCGLLSFADTRREVLTLAADYANRAMALVEKERRERLQLSLDVRGQAGEVLIRPNRLRLSLDVNISNGYLYLGWRGVVWQRNRWTREHPPRLWDCTSDLTRLVARAHDAEQAMVARIEAEAVDIRRRWFALVRLVHYMNVIEKQRLEDFESGRIQTGSVGALPINVIRRLLGVFRSRSIPRTHVSAFEKMRR